LDLSEANPNSGIISYQSPLGQALLGKAVGDEVMLELKGTVKDRVVKYIVLKIK